MAIHNHSSEPNTPPAVVINDARLAAFLNSPAAEQDLPALPAMMARREREEERTMRLVPVDTDAMEPTLRKGDAVAVVPATTLTADGLYVLDHSGAPRIYRCQADFRGGVHLLSDNKVYPTDHVPMDTFTAALLGKAVMTCNWICRPDAGGLS